MKCATFTYRSSRDSVKPTKRIAVRENKFWKDCEKRYFPTKLLKNTFDLMNLNEIEHSKCKNIEHQRAPSGSFKIEVQPVSPFRLLCLRRSLYDE